MKTSRKRRRKPYKNQDSGILADSSLAKGTHRQEQRQATEAWFANKSVVRVEVREARFRLCRGL